MGSGAARRVTPSTSLQRLRHEAPGKVRLSAPTLPMAGGPASSVEADARHGSATRQDAEVGLGRLKRTPKVPLAASKTLSATRTRATWVVPSGAWRVTGRSSPPRSGRNRPRGGRPPRAAGRSWPGHEMRLFVPVLARRHVALDHDAVDGADDALWRSNAATRAASSSAASRVSSASRRLKAATRASAMACSNCAAVSGRDWTAAGGTAGRPPPGRARVSPVPPR